jgi:hypothetical protein
MITKNFLAFLLLLFFVKCSNRNPYEKLAGFWVSEEQVHEKPFRTLTIKDSAIELNRYGVENYSFALERKDNYFKALYPFDSWETAILVHVKEDTLLQIFLNGENDTVRYSRMDSLSLFRDLVLCDALPKIILPEADEQGNLVLSEKSLVCNLYIGPLKRGVQRNFPKIAEDSIVLQVYDVLISFTELKEFLQQQQSNVDEAERDEIGVVLYADKDTSMKLLEEIKQAIHRFNYKWMVYRAHINWNKRKFFYKVI